MSRQTYGYLRITEALRREGLLVNKKKTARLMRENGICGLRISILGQKQRFLSTITPFHLICLKGTSKKVLYAVSPMLEYGLDLF